MGLFSLAFRRSAGSLWLAAALSLLFSLVFLLVYAAGDVLEGVYADAVMSQNTYTFTLKTRDISKFSDTSMLAYTVEEGRDYNVELSANGRSALLTRQSRGITISLAGAAFGAARSPLRNFCSRRCSRWRPPSLPCPPRWLPRAGERRFWAHWATALFRWRSPRRRCPSRSACSCCLPFSPRSPCACDSRGKKRKRSAIKQARPQAAPAGGLVFVIGAERNC